MSSVKDPKLADLLKRSSKRLTQRQENNRRCILIRKDIYLGLTDDERAELDDITARMAKRIEAKCPLPKLPVFGDGETVH